MLRLSIAGPSLAQAVRQIAMTSGSEVFCTIKAFIFAECTKLVCCFTPFDWHSTPAVDVWGISPMREREQGNKEVICYIDWCTRGFDQFGHENYDLLCGLGFAMTEMIMIGS